MEKIKEIVRIKQVVTENESDRFVVKNPENLADFLKKEIGDDDRESFYVCMLNTKQEVTAVHRAHVGTLNASPVHPREVFKAAILNNSYAILIGHNHPSGTTTPSHEDVKVTKRLIECGKVLGIEVLDHLIVSDKKYTSLKEEGYINESIKGYDFEKVR